MRYIFLYKKIPGYHLYLQYFENAVTQTAQKHLEYSKSGNDIASLVVSIAEGTIERGRMFHEGSQD